MTIQRHLSRLAGAFALVAATAFGGQARAVYFLSTTETVTAGNVGGITTLAPNTVVTINNASGGTFTETAVNGGLSFTDAAGSTIYLFNDAEPATGVGTTNVQMFVSVPAATNDNSVINFTTSIAAGTTAGASNIGTFTETLSSPYQIAVTSGSQYSVYQFPTAGTTITPSTATGAGQLVTVIGAAATAGQANNPGGPTVSGTFLSTVSVPEPASVAMLGAGLLGALGLSRVRKRSA